MHFKIDAKSLKAVTKSAIRATAKNTTIQTLKFFKVEANSEKSMIKVTGGNGELYISEKINADVIEGGSCLVPAQIFDEAIGKYSEEVELKISNGNLSIKAATSSMKLVTLDVSEFPKVAPIHEGTVDFTINREELLNIIGKVIFAASTDTTKGNITGVLVTVKKGTVTMVAVDGYRMAVYSDSVESNCEGKMVIPAKHFIEVQRTLLNSKETDVKVKADDKNVCFTAGDIRIVISLFGSDFVDYQNIFPKDHSTTVTVDKGQLYKAIDRSTLIAHEFKHNLVKLTFDKTEIRVESESEEGSIAESVPSKMIGNDLVIGFNARYVMDALRKIDEDEVTLELQSAIKPMVLRSGRYNQLVLPVRLR